MGSCAFWLKKKEKQACFPEKTRQHLQYLHFIQYTLYFPIQEKESKKIYYRPRLKRKCLFPSESIFNTASDFRRQESGNGKPPFRTKEWKINEEFSSGTTTRPLCLLPTTGNRHLPDGWPSILKLLTIFFLFFIFFNVLYDFLYTKHIKRLYFWFYIYSDYNFRVITETSELSYKDYLTFRAILQRLRSITITWVNQPRETWLPREEEEWDRSPSSRLCHQSTFWRAWELIYPDS